MFSEWKSRVLNAIRLPEPLVRPEIPGDVEAEFRAFSGKVMIRLTRWMVLAAAAATVVWWPSDYVVYHDQPDIIAAFRFMRITAVVVCAAVWFLTTRPAVIEKPIKTHLILGIVGLLLLGYAIGRMGGIEHSWYFGLYLVPFMTLPFFVGLVERFLIAVTLTSASLVGFFLPHPAYWRNPNVGSTLLMMLFGCAFAAVSGHGFYYLTRLSYWRHREVEIERRLLEQRVRVQTADLRRLALKIESAREEERARVAHELHDELGQYLSALRIETTLARKHIDGGPQESAMRLKRLDDLIAQTMGVARRVVTSLRPQVLSDFGLIAGVEWLVEQTRVHAGLDVRLERPDENFYIDQDRATAAYRIIQESLNNVVRHAEAGVVNVVLKTEGGRLSIVVEDNGRGLPTDNGHEIHGVGLLGNRERAIALGGFFAIERRPEGGTRVSVDVPLETTGGGR